MFGFENGNWDYKSQNNNTVPYSSLVSGAKDIPMSLKGVKDKLYYFKLYDFFLWVNDILKISLLLIHDIDFILYSAIRGSQICIYQNNM